MPSVSRKQHNFMEAVAHGMKPRKGGPSKAVAEEFVSADAGKSSRRRKSAKAKGEAHSRHPRNHDEFIALGNDARPAARGNQAGRGNSNGNS